MKIVLKTWPDGPKIGEMYLSEKTQEDYNKSPTLIEDFFTTSDSFEDEIDEAPDESDFLEPFDEDYKILDLWKSLRLLRRINRPEEIYDEDFDNAEYGDFYLDDEEKKQLPYVLKVLDEEDFGDLINSPYLRPADEESDQKEDIVHSEKSDESFEIEEEPEDLERRIAA